MQDISIAVGTGTDLITSSAGRGTRRTASTHSCEQITKLQQARSRSLGVREISVGAGSGADSMAGRACVAGPATDLLHQPDSASGSWHIPLKTKDIPKHSKILKDIPETNYFLGIS